MIICLFKIKNVCLLFVFSFLFINASFSQTIYKEFVLNRKKKQVSFPFQLIHNLVVIPLRINYADSLNFILDSGVTHTLLTDFGSDQKLTLKYAKKIEIAGLGEGVKITAWHSYGNQVGMPGGVIGKYHSLIVPTEKKFHLSESLGVPINGLLGYEVFNSFIVEIDYIRKIIWLRLAKKYAEKLRKRKQRWLKNGKATVIPLEIIKRKPYLTAGIVDEQGEQTAIKLLVDSGASFALSLYNETNRKIKIPEKSFYSFLGVGLSGKIFGHTGRISALKLGAYRVLNPVAVFPDTTYLGSEFGIAGGRNGSLGADVLRRFRVIFNYANRELILRPNRYFKTPFSYNAGGLEVVAHFPELPIFHISNVRKNSPAQSAGLQVGDQILAVNGQSTHRLNMNKLTELLRKTGKTLRITILRAGKRQKITFVSEDSLESRD